MDICDGMLEVENGLSLHYSIVGDGPETLVVPNAVWLEKSLSRLAEGRRVVFYDLRSRGRSDRADPARTGVAFDVQDLESIRAGLNLGPVNVLAHSYVSIVAVQHALRFPGAVKRMILVGAMPPSRLPYYERGFPTSQQMLYPPIPALQELREAGIDRSDPARFTRVYMETVIFSRQFSDPSNVSRYKHDAYGLPNEHPDHWITLFADHIFPSLGDWDLRPQLAGLQIPFLILQGQKDGPEEAAREWVRIAPHGKLIMIPDSGHAPFVEQPEIFFKAAEEFLKK